MSATSCMLTEEELCCAICLEVFTFPVTLPCGHNFCRACITTQWEVIDLCQCPMCKEDFDQRPSLRINNFISEMAVRFKQTTVMKPRNSFTNISSSNGTNNPTTTGSRFSSIISSLNSNSSGVSNVRRISNIISSMNSNSSGVNGNSSGVNGNTSGVNSNSSHSSGGNSLSSGVNSSSSIRSISISNASDLQQQVAKQGDIPCDECTGIILKAVKSCLQCLTSYCETHVKPHKTTVILKSHTLLDPVENLGARMCLKHKNPLELFCKIDNMIICIHCKLLEHEKHICVFLEDECKEKKGMLGLTALKLHQMIQERRVKIQHLRRVAQMNEETADGQKAVGNQVFTDLQNFLKHGLEELMLTLVEELHLTVQLNESLIKELGCEISELMQKSADVQQLSGSDDYFDVVQSFAAINNIPAMKDWSEVRVQQPLYEKMVREAVVEATDKLVDTFKKEKKKLLEAELSRVQQYEVDVVLDPKTASPWLELSDDGKQARRVDMKKTLAKTSERFCPEGGVLAMQSFQSGRFYFEVQVQGLMRWDLGVVKESINRKEKVTKSQQAGHWILSLRKGGELRVRCSHDIRLSEAWHPQRVGVFVDYDQGLVSFYDVKASELIYAFTDSSFTETLYPFVNPGQSGTNSRLIISPTQCMKVTQTPPPPAPKPGTFSKKASNS